MNGFCDSEVQEIEIELVGKCNLRCPSCASVLFPERVGQPHIRKLSEWVSQLDRYVSLRSVCISGICSEPTLYPCIFEFMDYLVGRNIRFELLTNASTHDDKWWNELNKHLTKDDTVVFTICGSTQELHERYRVGQDLQTMLGHAEAFKTGNPNRNDCIQHILFKYNQRDFEKNMKSIIQRFSRHILIKTPPYFERFRICHGPDGICPPGNDEIIYRALVQNAMMRRQKGRFNIDCMSKRCKYLALDQFGNEYPCNLFRLLSNSSFDKKNFDKIDGFGYEFCYDCEKTTSRLMKHAGIEDMV